MTRRHATQLNERNEKHKKELERKEQEQKNLESKREKDETENEVWPNNKKAKSWKGWTTARKGWTGTKSKETKGCQYWTTLYMPEWELQ